MRLPDPLMSNAWLPWAQSLFVWLRDFSKRQLVKSPGDLNTPSVLITAAAFAGTKITYYIQNGYCFFTCYVTGNFTVGGVTEDSLAQMPALDSGGLSDCQYECLGALHHTPGGPASLTNPLIKLFINSSSPTLMKIWMSQEVTVPEDGYILSGFYKVKG
jgi:hypothetical protein